MTLPSQAVGTTRPFAPVPDPARYFPAQSQEEARRRISRSVQRAEGPVLVIAGAGLGKSLLLEVVAKQFEKQLQTVKLDGAQLCTRRALLQTILFQLELPYREMDESELRLMLLSHLQPPQGAPKQILLLIDEANALPIRLLEELRGLSQLSANGLSLVNMVLAGAPVLEEQFTDPKLNLFSQRISARCYLAPFGRGETFQYVRAQVASLGGEPAEVFEDDALEAIFGVTDGVPRLINQLADQLMWTISETGYAPLDGPIVQQAWSEIQQLPAPWNTRLHETQSTPVEFGELDSSANHFAEDYETADFEDFDEDLPASIPLRVINADNSTDLTGEACAQSAIAETDRLLKELDSIDENESAAAASPSATSASSTTNPFSEAFDCEEIVADPYSAFEYHLLGPALRVQNQSDCEFSEQLRMLELEIAPAVTATEDELEAAILLESSTACAGSNLYSDSVVSSDEISAGDILSPGDILVIEEETIPSPEIVSGDRFRQLFSQLERECGEARVV